MLFQIIIIFISLRMIDNENISSETEISILNTDNNNITGDTYKNTKPIQLNIKQNLIINQILSFYALQSDVSDPLCKKHSKKFKEDFRAFKPWALKMFDSSSKLQPGVLAGNLMDFGSFEQCLDISEDTIYGTIKGQHCVVEIQAEEKIMKIILSYRNFTMKQLYEISGKEGATLKWSICLPDSCPASDVEAHFRKSLASITEGVDVNLTVRKESCVSKENKKPFSFADWAALSFFGIIILLTILSTLYDVFSAHNMNNSLNKILRAFSIYSNFKKLSKEPHSDQMSAIYGLRFITMSWIICGHRFLMLMFFPVDNTLDILNWTTEISNMIVIGGTFSVDTFFIISGLLVSFIFLKQMEKGVKFNLIAFWLHRYLRLTPVFGAVVLIYATLLYHLSSGPLWEDLMDAIHRPCYKYWWSALLYVQNIFNPGDMCVVQTWYLMCDTQMFFLSPIFLIPLWKWPKYGLLQICILIILSMIISFKLAWINNYRGGMPVTNALLTTDYFKYHYIATYTRASPWLLGIILGYILHYTKNFKIKIKRKTVITAWCTTVIVMASLVFGAYPFVQVEYPYRKLEECLYLATSRFVWGLAISWTIFACVHGYGGVINTFLSIKLFQIWGRISYTMFLFHMFVQYLISGSERTQTHFSNALTVYMFFGDFIYTSGVALIFTLMFESPFIIIESLILEKGNMFLNVMNYMYICTRKKNVHYVTDKREEKNRI